MACTLTRSPSTEVTQQSKARHKDDFLNAFSPFIADATAVAYKGAPVDIQAKLRRVVDVWKERNIFDREVMQDLDAKLAGQCCDTVTHQTCADADIVRQKSIRLALP